MEQTRNEVFDLFTIKSPQKSLSKPESTSFITEDISDVVEDVFIKTKSQTTHSTPSKSDTKSYRDRINERFKNVKEKAGKSTRKASDLHYKWHLERVKKESNVVDIELATFREKSSRVKTQSLNDFFYNKHDFTFEKSTETLTESKEEDLHFVQSKTLKLELKESEDQILYKIRPKEVVSVADKIGTVSSSNLQEIHVYPKLTNKKKNILDQRLINDNLNWFDNEGQLLFTEDPRLDISFSPELKVSNNQLVYSHKIFVDNLEEVVTISEYILNLKICKLKFLHHPYFSFEHVLAQKLISSFNMYKKYCLSDNLNSIKSTLQTLRDKLKCVQAEDESEKNLLSIIENIKQCEHNLLDELKSRRECTKSILINWHNLKKIRTITNCSNTNLKLTIQKELTNFENDKIFINSELDFFLQTALINSKEPEQDLRYKLKQKIRECYRGPGEPILSFFLTETHQITENSNNPKEVIRRSTINSTKLYLRIVCNKIEVCKINSVKLNDKFEFFFDEMITIQLQEIPKFITCEIYEQTRSLPNILRGEIKINLPQLSKTTSKKTLYKNFENAEIIYCNKHTGVGSEVNIEKVFNDLPIDEFKCIEPVNLKTRGELFYTVCWEPSTRVSFAAEYSENLDIRENDNILDKYNRINLLELNEWIESIKPDFEKNDYMEPLDNSQFRLKPYIDNFVDLKVITENVRLKYLQLRNYNEPEFDGVLIPNRIREISLNLLENYEKRLALGKDNNGEDSDDEVDKKRNKGRQFLKQIHIKVFQRCKNAENNLSYEDVVDEKLLPYFEKVIKSISRNVLNWFKLRPLKMPLLPTLTRDIEYTSTCPTIQTNIVVTIFSGLNIALRAKSNIAQPFLEMEFNNYTVRTPCGEGKNPLWSDTVRFGLENDSIDYLNPNALNGNLVIKLFDETDTVLKRFSNVKQRIYLGSVEIPVASIRDEPLQGMFLVKKPILSLGYQELDLDYSKKTSNDNFNVLQQDTFLSLSITLVPNIPRLNPSIGELPCSDLPYLKEYVLKWNEKYNYNYPNRKFSVFVIDSNASTNCITRYFKPLEPPQINLQGFDVTPIQCLRFVSLIPFTDCNNFYQNICLTAAELLKFAIGSILDHAITLTCFFLSLKLDCWLLLGFGLPYGSSAFVLVKEIVNNIITYFIFDVVKFIKVDITNPLCPLQKVYCVINNHNIWANTQRNDDINMLRMDFTKESDWLPLFNDTIQAPTNSVQRPITYSPIHKSNELELLIDKKVKKTITKLRKFDRTIWNHHVSNVIKLSLESFENSEMYNKSNFEAIEKIRECLTNYEIYGHILSFSYNNFSSIKTRVVDLGVHLDENRFTEFATSVYVKAYPSSVYAVWMFVGTTQQKQK